MKNRWCAHHPRCQVACKFVSGVPRVFHFVPPEPMSRPSGRGAHKGRKTPPSRRARQSMDYSVHKFIMQAPEVTSSVSIRRILADASGWLHTNLKRQRGATVKAIYQATGSGSIWEGEAPAEPCRHNKRQLHLRLPSRCHRSSQRIWPRSAKTLTPLCLPRPRRQMPAAAPTAAAAGHTTRTAGGGKLTA